MRDAIQGMLSMSQMGRQGSQSLQLLQSQQPVKYYSDDIEEQLNSCYKDDEFGLFHLEISYHNLCFIYQQT